MNKNQIRARALIGKPALMTSNEYILRLVEIRKGYNALLLKHKRSKGFVLVAKQDRAYVSSLITREKEMLRWEKVWDESDGEIWIPDQEGFDPLSVP